MNIWLILVLTITPAIIIMFIIHHKDKIKKEPKRICLRAILGGIVAIIIAFFVESFFSPALDPISNIWIHMFVESFLIAGLIEESSKLLGFRLFVWKKEQFNEITDGMVLLAAVGLTFAAIENVLYGITGDLSTILVRDLTAVPAHGMMTGIMGFFVGYAKVQKKKIFIVIGLIIAILIHGLYDFCAFASNNIDGFFFIGVIGNVIFSSILFWRLFKHATRMDIQ
jgi:protease PrsW